MKRDQYLQLIQGSLVFQGMEQRVKDDILAAEGAKLERYAAIFLSAQTALKKAKEDFVMRNREIIERFRDVARNVQKEKLKDDETRAEKADTAASEKLLQDIHNS